MKDRNETEVRVGDKVRHHLSLMEGVVQAYGCTTAEMQVRNADGIIHYWPLSDVVFWKRAEPKPCGDKINIPLAPEIEREYSEKVLAYHEDRLRKLERIAERAVTDDSFILTAMLNCIHDLEDWIVGDSNEAWGRIKDRINSRRRADERAG